MSELRKIIKIAYEGEKDAQGLPHGKGRMEYFADEDHVPYPEHPDGSWRQGIRQKRWDEMFKGTWKDDLPYETTHWLGMPSEHYLDIIRTTCKDVLATTMK